MILADILFKQGFGTRYDCRSIAASGAVSIDGRELTDPDEDFDPEGLVLTWRGMQWPVSDNVGRLDWDTTGLLLFTDNGALLHRLTHPKKHVNKVYRATLSHPAANGTCEKLLSGVVLDDDPKPVFAKAAELRAPDVLMLTISQGKYHQVKRMVAACGNRVVALHRIKVGAYELPADLKPGEWCWLCGPESVLGEGSK